MRGSWSYPFTAIVGQERMKMALCLNAVDPLIGGVLIRGKRGTAKSTAVRALAHLLPGQPVVVGCRYGCHPEEFAGHCFECRARADDHAGPLPAGLRRMRVVELPVHASEDRVVGTIDLEAALREGAKRFEPGVLADAHRNILYVDEVNLLEDHIVDALLDAAAMGVNIVEREGMSMMHPARFILVGTMNPEEGELRPQLLDRFGLCVDVVGIDDPELRVQVAERDDAFQRRDAAFLSEYEAADRELAGQLAAAVELCTQVSICSAHQTQISQICADAGAEGHRADLVTARAARALAALRGRRAVNRDDYLDAAELALAHRARKAVRQAVEGLPEEQPKPAERPDDAQNQLQQGETRSDRASGGEDPKSEPRENNSSSDAEDHSRPSADGGEGETDGTRTSGDVIVEATAAFRVKPLELPKKQQVRRQSGRRGVTRSPDRRGRYVRAMAQEKVTDLAVDATVRAAAPHQVQRGRDLGEKLRIERQDLRQKVRERKVGNLIVFAVDASASMDAEKRMSATKGAVLSLLQDAYVRRDRVAVIVFKNRTAEVVLPPTAGAALAQKRLARLGVGGTTPLSHGLVAAYSLIKTEQVRDQTLRPLMVLISDGHGNVSMSGQDPVNESRKVASRFRHEKIESLVIDAARDHIDAHLNIPTYRRMYHNLLNSSCAALAEHMGARYYGLRDLSRDEIAAAVVSHLAERT